MRRKHILSLGGALVVLLISLVYIFGPILHTPLGEKSPRIAVQLTRSGGLFTGSTVTYRGIVVGKVTAIDLTRSGVEATVQLHPGTKIPRASKVQVRSLSPIGEQYLDFQPASSAAPFLASGDTIQAAAVDLPQTVADLSISLNRLMNEVDPAKVHTVLSELSTALDGTQEDVQSLLSNGLTLINTADDNSAVISQLLTQSNTLLRVGADEGPTIIRASRSFAVFSHWLRAFQPDLYRTLRSAPGQIEELRQLVQDLSQTLPDLLMAQGSLAEILQARDPHLRALLQSFPLLLESFSSAIRGGSVHLDVIPRHGQQCVYANVERDPRDTSYRKLQDNGYCSTSLTTYSQRGTQFAPPPVK